ncbi:unnamed protein product [Durusdinium trenchii]|uniref:Heterogeneous nuclear ribonucleoprotein U-like protein 1 (Adenovirus early region 1B-associated protein 5) (E1B-55 kDa-associated protein 5) (E1B-AP5) n=2 Tax=Durusdinium trenchii TaxID=1381693 RepID=A0ABP0NAL1_9DINO
MEEPAAKKQKTEEAPAEEAVPAVPAEPEEKEQDAVRLKGDRLKEPVTFHTNDTTLNVMVSSSGSSTLLMPLSDGGIRHLLAGARASVGLKAGRYLFEAKVLEHVQRQEDGAKPTPKHILRLGFSTKDSPLLMGGTTDVCFDMEGFLIQEGKRTPLGVGTRYGKGSVVGVLLNLDKKSPNAYTISLFKDGKRVCQPQALPDELHGKTLFPTINYRNVAVSVSFSGCQAALPFTCDMVQDAMVSHSVVTPADTTTEFEVLFPCCLPDQGGFDWLDLFKAKNPQYIELSDRMIMDWAEKSGITCPKLPGSNDKPEMKFGIPEMEDMSIRRMISSMAPLQKRNYIIMEMRSNLIKELRTDGVARFFDSSFKKRAFVVMGDPSIEFKKKSQELLLKDKQEQIDAQFKKEKEEANRKKMMEKKQKEAEKAKKKAEKERLKKMEEFKKSQEKAKKEAERKKAEEQGLELPDEEEEAEEAKDEEMEEEDEDEVEEDEVEVEEDPPKATLTPEEKKMPFRKLPNPDISTTLLNTSFTKFTLPDLEEGFDDVHFEWTKGGKAAEVLQKWIMERKLTSRVEDLSPSAWFKTKWSAWQKQVHTWQNKQTEYKGKMQKKATEKAQKEARKLQAAKVAEAKAAAEKAKKEQEKAEKAEKEEDEEEEKEEEEVKEEEEEKVDPMEVDEEEEEEVDFEGVDIFGVDEVDDIGAGTPLYKDFTAEDWTLMSLCYELHLMAGAFKKDCDDPDRKGIILEHLGFYYNRYYAKNLTPKNYGVESEADLVNLAKDCVFVNKDKVLESLLDDEIEYPQVFVKIAEEGRRHRALLVDMGDESAKLKFVVPKGPMKGSGPFEGHKGDKGFEKGFDKGFDKGFGKSFEKGFDKGSGKGFGKVPLGPGMVTPMSNPMATMAQTLASQMGISMMGKGGKGFGMPFKGKGWKGK